MHIGFLDKRTKKYQKNHMGAALNFPSQYEENGNDLLKEAITSYESWIHFYSERKSVSMFWGKKEGEASRKFKNERSTRQVILIAFWNCHGLVYAKFDPGPHKEKQNVSQGTYFDTLMHLRNSIWSKIRGMLIQNVVLIHDNVCPHRAQLIQTLLKDFCWEQLE